MSALQHDAGKDGQKQTVQGQPDQFNQSDQKNVQHALYGHVDQSNHTGQPMTNQFGQPTINQFGQTIVSQAGQPMVNQVGQPMANQAGQPAFYQPVQPIMTQPGIVPFGQQMVVQNQYGQPVIVQGGVPMAMPIPIDPNNPAQNEHPVSTKCPHCQIDITTEREYVVGSCTWLWCILLGTMGCIFCCFLPFLWKGAKDVVHTCPNCKKEVGRFIRQQRSNVRIHAGGGHYRRRRRRRRR
ncbi:lipopolysaccharide-induced tumor necrosis factor-alpha factor homolog [Mytilus californianus]|uniref:lipopolysaccharide-induced tumor necrosis factor-alpha factor homolog n=1 Tax=Mytilus californianus TaxID=6549 RepID=UPI002245A3CC|nr:lipopolysaccharide-induced tumor necrosis factor-alpha factor homolog [Mytilus californianus]